MFKSSYPETRPIPVIIPPAGTSSFPYNSYAANWENSKKGVLQNIKWGKKIFQYILMHKTLLSFWMTHMLFTCSYFQFAGMCTVQHEPLDHCVSTQEYKLIMNFIQKT